LPMKSKAPRPHGDRQKYLKEKCHCPECTEAQRQYMEDYRRSKEGIEAFFKTRPRKQAEHGTRTMYQRYKCQCDDCVEANRAYAREWKRHDTWKRRAGIGD
jgi:hypothetical protein